jgi:CRP-like cAMP-binding protein
VQIVAAHFLKSFLIFLTAFAVCPEIVSAILDQFVPQLFALRTARALETDDDEQERYGKYESQSFLHLLLLSMTAERRSC